MDRVIDGAAWEMVGLAEDFRAKQIGLEGWMAGMRGLIKDVHLAIAIAGRGGWQRMRSVDIGLVGQRLGIQSRRL